MIFKTDLGDEIHRYKKSIVVLFKGKRRVLSTSPINGGYNEDLKAIFNNDCNPGAGMACELKAPTYEEHMELIADELGLNSDTTAGIGTAASMTSLYIHLLDQYDWRLLNQGEVKETAAVILGNVQKLLNVKAPADNTFTEDDHFIRWLTGLFEEVLARAAGKLEENSAGSISGGDDHV